MSSASNSAGIVGKWGQTSFTAISTHDNAKATPKKFFKSRNTNRLGTPASSLSAKTPAKSCPKTDQEVHVCVRVRPKQEVEEESVLEWNENEGEIYLNMDKTFKFDHVLGPDSSQMSVYTETISPLLDSFVGDNNDLTGLNVAILAYGQTSTGKTFTMGTDYNTKKHFKNEDDVGIIPRVLKDLFSRLDLELFSTIRISFFEILNEKIYDLTNVNKIKVPLKLKEDGNGFAIPDLSNQVVCSLKDALDLLEQGSSTRSTGPTSQNESSSRSHAIFRITVQEQDQESGIKVEKRINLVDLAGSESVGRSNTAGPSRIEGVNINKGLSVLGRCISSICHNEKHIPFRDSNLTKVLRECFVSGGLTTMIACISQSEEDLRETVNTLRYADCVKDMEKPKMPSHLMSTLNMSAQKRRMNLIPPTPLHMRKRFLNHTIETPTPTKKIRTSSNLNAISNLKMNSTIGTPGSCMERRNNNPDNNLLRMEFKAPSLETIVDENEANLSHFSEISSINPSNSFSTSRSFNTSNIMDATEMRSVFSPMMRKLKEDLQREFTQTVRKEFEAAVLLTQKKNRSKSSDERPVIKRRRSSRLLQKEQQHDESDQEQLQVPEASPSLNLNLDENDETFISGPQFTQTRQKMREVQEKDQQEHLEHDIEIEEEEEFVIKKPRAPSLNNRGLRDVTNEAKVRHMEKVEKAASPILKGQIRTPPRMSMEEMARAMGIDPNSPSLAFESQRKPTNSKNKENLVKRSLRRTTMMQPELNRSLMALKERPKSVRRSTRISSNKMPEFLHPLEEKKFWKIQNQSEHNNKILNILNTANMRMLQSLPGIGPKTAISLHSYRELHVRFDSLEELKEVKGLSRTFFQKFCIKNQIVL